MIPHAQLRSLFRGSDISSQCVSLERLGVVPVVCLDKCISAWGLTLSMRGTSAITCADPRTPKRLYICRTKLDLPEALLALLSISQELPARLRL